jgi:hypothetical protein
MTNTRQRTKKDVPSFESALDALLSGNAKRAAALFATSAIADPKDWISRANRSIALYNAERWADAVTAFKADIDREGFEAPGAVPALFCIGYCRLQLGDIRGSLIATTAFLDLSNEEHPFYADGIENTCCAWERLDRPLLAASLRHRRWKREKIIGASFRILGVDSKPRLPRKIDWFAAGT